MQRGMIVAMTPGRVIAVDGKIPWYYPSDMDRFKRITLGCAVIMGRRTFESMKCKPLIKRENIVLTSNKDHGYKDVKVYSSLLEAINVCEHYQQSYWIIGGSRVYEEAMPLVDYIDITIVPNEFSHLKDAELTYFPIMDNTKDGVHVKQIHLSAQDKFQYGAWEDPRGVRHEFM